MKPCKANQASVTVGECCLAARQVRAGKATEARLQGETVHLPGWGPGAGCVTGLGRLPWARRACDALSDGAAPARQVKPAALSIQP